MWSIYASFISNLNLIIYLSSIFTIQQHQEPGNVFKLHGDCVMLMHSRTFAFIVLKTSISVKTFDFEDFFSLIFYKEDYEDEMTSPGPDSGYNQICFR